MAISESGFLVSYNATIRSERLLHGRTFSPRLSAAILPALSQQRTLAATFRRLLCGHQTGTAREQRCVHNALICRVPPGVSASSRRDGSSSECPTRLGFVSGIRLDMVCECIANPLTASNGNPENLLPHGAPIGVWDDRHLLNPTSWSALFGHSGWRGLPAPQDSQAKLTIHT